MTVKNPGRSKKGEERKTKVKKVTVVLDDEVEAALDLLVKVAKEHVGFRAKKSAVVWKAILEAAGRLISKP